MRKFQIGTEHHTYLFSYGLPGATCTCGPELSGRCLGLDSMRERHRVFNVIRRESRATESNWRSDRRSYVERRSKPDEGSRGPALAIRSGWKNYQEGKRKWATVGKLVTSVQERKTADWD
jgi:hypothetical protein